MPYKADCSMVAEWRESVREGDGEGGGEIRATRINKVNKGEKLNETNKHFYCSFLPAFVLYFRHISVVFVTRGLWWVSAVWLGNLIWHHTVVLPFHYESMTDLIWWTWMTREFLSVVQYWCCCGGCVDPCIKLGKLAWNLTLGANISISISRYGVWVRVLLRKSHSLSMSKQQQVLTL